MAIRIPNEILRVPVPSPIGLPCPKCGEGNDHTGDLAVECRYCGWKVTR